MPGVVTARRGRVVPRAARRPLLLLLALGLAGAFLVLWLRPAALSYPIDPAGYDGIRTGMSRAEVVAHMGVKSGYYAKRGNPCLRPVDGTVDQSKWTGWWFGNQYAIAVEYDDQGRVTAKALYRVTWLDAAWYDAVKNWGLQTGRRLGLW